jgi:colicin import membrane protein
MPASIAAYQPDEAAIPAVGTNSVLPLAADQAVTCKYPGCEDAPAPADGSGRPPGYCRNPDHTALKAWRERQRLAARKTGTTVSEAETEQPVTMARASAMEMLREMRTLADKMTGIAERVRDCAETIGDPAAAEAEMEAGRAAAEERAAVAEAARAEADRRTASTSQLRALADEAAEEKSGHLVIEQARIQQAQQRLAAAIEQQADR